MSLFRSIQNIVPPMEKDDIAKQITEETIAEHIAARKGREDQPWDAADTDRMQRLAALMVGPRKHVAIPIILKAFPQMVMLLKRDFGHVSVMPWPGALETDSLRDGEIKGPGGRKWRWSPKDVKSGEMSEGCMVTFVSSDDGVATQIDVIENPHE